MREPKMPGWQNWEGMRDGYKNITFFATLPVDHQVNCTLGDAGEKLIPEFCTT